MKLPSLFKKSGSQIVSRENQDRAERLLAESFRMLSQVCLKMADYVETQRLSRQGYESQGKYLERLDEKAADGPGKKGA